MGRAFPTIAKAFVNLSYSCHWQGYTLKPKAVRGTMVAFGCQQCEAEIELEITADEESLVRRVDWKHSHEPRQNRDEDRWHKPNEKFVSKLLSVLSWIEADLVH